MSKPLDAAFLKRLERLSPLQRDIELREIEGEHGAGFAAAVRAELTRRIEARKAQR